MDQRRGKTPSKKASDRTIRTLPEDIEKFQATQKLWNVLLSIFLKRNIDPTARLQAWVTACRNELRTSGADFDFEALSRAGCSSLILCCCFRALKFFPVFNAEWQKIMGDRRHRERHIRDLNSTANLIESLFKIAKLDPDQEKRIWPDEGLLPQPSKVVGGLRMYAYLIGSFDRTSRETSVRTSLDLPRFLLTEYAHVRTGRWHDKQVSALIQAADPDGSHDENSQKMWRKRNYKKLNKHYANYVLLLRDFADAVML